MRISLKKKNVQGPHVVTISSHFSSCALVQQRRTINHSHCSEDLQESVCLALCLQQLVEKNARRKMTICLHSTLVNGDSNVRLVRQFRRSIFLFLVKTYCL